MSNMLHKRLNIRRRCRKCGGLIVNKPEIGATCVKCGWTNTTFTINTKQFKEIADMEIERKSNE